VQLFSKISNRYDHNPPTSQTDRRTDRETDGRTTCDRKTALCTKVHCEVKNTAESVSQRWKSGTYSQMGAVTLTALWTSVITSVITPGRVRAGPSFQLGTLASRAVRSVKRRIFWYHRRPIPLRQAVVTSIDRPSATRCVASIYL